MSTTTPLRLEQVTAILDGRYPAGLAESWDRVGLVVGDPEQPVRRVLFAVDPVAVVVDEAIAWGADLIVTHHPLLLRGAHSVAATGAKGKVIHRLIQAGIGLYAAHTNADSVVDGVADALAALVGVVDTVPLVPTRTGAATAGSTGTGSTGTASAGTGPAGAGTGIGRVGRLAQPTTLHDFAATVAAALPSTVQGVRYAGDPEAIVQTVAVLGGSGDSLFDEVRATGADVYLTSDLRHHPASEQQEEAYLAERLRGRATPYLVEAPHFATEWPWLPHAARLLVADAAAAGATVVTRVSTRCTDPWTGRIDSPTPPDRDDVASTPATTSEDAP